MSDYNSLNHMPKAMTTWSGKSADMQRHAAETRNTELSAKANEIWYDTTGAYGGIVSALPWLGAAATTVGALATGKWGSPVIAKNLKIATGALVVAGAGNHMVQNWRKESDYRNAVDAAKTKAQVESTLAEMGKEGKSKFSSDSETV